MRVRWGCPVTLGFALLVVATLLVVARPYDQTYAVFTEPAGQIEAGERFGVAVGMPIEQARQSLAERGWQEDTVDISEFLPEWRRGHCLGRVKRGDESIVRFDDDSWRSGDLCIFVGNGEVRAIAWSYWPLLV